VVANPKVKADAKNVKTNVQQLPKKPAKPPKVVNKSKVVTEVEEREVEETHGQDVDESYEEGYEER
jgi:hypothetical protein